VGTGKERGSNIGATLDFKTRKNEKTKQEKQTRIEQETKSKTNKSTKIY